VANDHVHAPVTGHDRDQLLQEVRPLQDLEDGPDLRALGELRLGQHVHDPIGEDVLDYDGVRVFQELGHDLAHVRRERWQLGEAAPDLRRGLASQLGVQGRRGSVELRLADGGIRGKPIEHAPVKAALRDVAVNEDQDAQARPVRQLDELDMAEARAPRARRCDDRGAAGAGGQDRGGEAQPLVARQLHLAELVANHELVGVVERCLAHERLHVGPIAQVGRHATGARVRMGQQAHRFKLGHGAADRG
jgi:hypothetical protein